MEILTKNNMMQFWFVGHPADLVGVAADQKLLRVCAWCFPKHKQEFLLKEGFEITHGICPECKSALIFKQTTTNTH
jgi:hypothetical protein